MYLEDQVKHLAFEVKRLEEVVNDIRKELDTKPMSTKEAAECLGIHEVTLRKRMSEGKVPFHKLGGKNIFYKSELIKSNG